MEEAKYVIYGDESSHTDGRYKSVCLVTLEQANNLNFNNELSAILSESNISSEFKWQKLKDTRYEFAANKMIDFTFNKILQNKLRVDVLTWDIEDYRHKNIKNRDDIANLQRMYFRLLKDVMSKRWTRNEKWDFMPDENSAIDWNILQQILQYENIKSQYSSPVDIISFLTKVTEMKFKKDIKDNQLLLNLIKYSDILCPNFSYHLNKITESCSKQYPLIQLADFFAGISIFSKKDYLDFKQWQEDQSPQLNLLPTSNNMISWSKSKKKRFLVLQYLINKSKANKLQISFRSTQGLETRNPNENINFWFYKPQHVNDTAPVKSRTI